MSYDDKKDRTLIIFFRAVCGEDISIKKLSAEFGVSSKTITRDINDIKAFLDEHREELEYSELRYDYQTHTYHLYIPNCLADKELLLIVKILTASRAVSRGDMITLIGKLKAMSSLSDRKLIDSLTNNELYYYTEVGADIQHIDDRLWQISKAIEAKKEISISYYKMDRTEIIRRILPAAVMFSEYYFYLIAFHLTDDGEAEERFYRIDRITAVVEHRDRTMKDMNYCEGELRQQNQFMFPGKCRKILFEFTGPSVQAVLDRLPTAKLINVKNGVSTIEAVVYGDGIKMWLMSQGEWVRVLEPDELADEIRHTAERIIGRYKSYG